MAITNVFAEWNDDEQAFGVLLEIDDGERESRWLRPFHRCVDGFSNPDPEEARIMWGVLIHCPRQTDGGDVADRVLRLRTKAKAERVAKRAKKELADLRAGKPPLSDHVAQTVYMLNGGTGRIGFSLDMLRGKVAGA